MKNSQSKFKSLFQNLFRNIRKNHLYQAYLVTLIVAIILLILGMVLENNKLLNNKFLSDFMSDCFQAHQNEEKNAGYVIYYLLLYIFVLLYIVPSLTILVHRKTNNQYWCIYIIFLSIIFLVFMNAYLTEMLQYNNDSCQAIYEMHLTSFISITTIIIGIAGIKLSVLLKIIIDNEKENEIEKASNTNSDNN